MPSVPSKPGQADSSSSSGVSQGSSGAANASGGSPTDGSSSDDDKSGAAAAGKGDGGNGQGSQGGGAANEAGVGGGQAIAAPERTGQVSHAGGGSSPLVPILIALAVLAAISIGVVAIRRRNQGRDRSDTKSRRVSPEAG